MAGKVFIMLSSGDKEIATTVALVYPLNAAKNKWMDEIKVIVFGPASRHVAHDAEVQQMLKKCEAAGVEVMVCKWCADKLGVTAAIEQAGFKVFYVGETMSQLMKDGWASLTF